MRVCNSLVGAGALAFGLAAAALAGPTRAEEAPAAKPKSSDVCYNAGLYDKGAFVDYEYKLPGLARGVQRETYLVNGKKKFNGANATEIKVVLVEGAPEEITTLIYRDTTKDFLLSYGSDNGDSESTISPAEKFPIAAKQGDQLKQSVVLKVSFKGGSRTYDRKTVTTFNGFEKISFKFGTFNTCKFTVKTTMKEKGSSDADTYNDVRWIAAEGPYRGWLLKVKYGQVDSVYQVTKFNAFDVK